MGESEFNWYSILSNSDDITQGDIFINFPVINISNYNELLEKDNLDDFSAELEVEYIDCIVMTQPCDIAQNKKELENIILCKIHDVNEIQYGKSKLCSIVEGRVPQFYMLNKCEEFGYKDNRFSMEIFDFHVVNFDIIQKVPIEALKKYAMKVPKRLRLLPPYREHLSQAFAKYFMRIGLPSDINKQCFEKYAKK